MHRFNFPALGLLAFALVSLPFARATEDYTVTWDSPGKGHKDSMPIGNGDIGLNLWTEQNGDIVFLVSKADAWSENGQLVKLGRVRVTLDPSPFKPGTSFRQTLKPSDGEIEVRGDSSTVLRAWVDANSPVIHLEVDGGRPMALRAQVELWRTKPRVTKQNGVELHGIGSLRELNGIPGGEITIDPDTVFPARNNQLTWCHFNTRSIYPLTFENQHLQTLLGKYPDPLLNRAFGMAMKGPGLVSANDRTLQSSRPQSDFRLDLYALTKQPSQLSDWQVALAKTIASADATPLETARTAHQKWWDDFWNRSWIKVSGDEAAKNVTQGYAMQRWMNAGAGRGAMPMKFNGSIFTVGQEPTAEQSYDPAKGQTDADFRRWGGNYWFQNTRHLYWPMMASGDFDTLLPLFKMYIDALPLAKDRVRTYHQHDGAIFPETIYFWGLPNNNDFGWGNQNVEIKNTWIRHHVNGGLELTAMMLDAYDFSGSETFAKQFMLPLAVEITTYFDQHWKRVNGKILFDPSQALEVRQQAVNPAQDIAGLMYVLPRLLALPQTLTTPGQREMWKKTLADLPPLPRGRTDAKGKNPETLDQMTPNGTPILLTADKFSKPGNVENSELYSIFPFRLFGVDLPELDFARDTYNAKLFKSSTCWGQDGIQAACLGWADRAKEEVTRNFTTYGGERFKWFWSQGHDHEPDMDNGGAGQTILQSMLIQTRGDKVLLFPAWPKEWDVDFKLRAPKNTVIEGLYRAGKLEKLKVTPESRAKDVVRLAPQ
jgi:hypothetical protein